MLKGKTVYVLSISSSTDYETANSVGTFEHKKDAQAFMRHAYSVDKKDYINRWGNGSVEKNIDDNSAYVYLAGDYTRYHVDYQITKTTIQ